MVDINIDSSAIKSIPEPLLWVLILIVGASVVGIGWYMVRRAVTHEYRAASDVITSQAQILTTQSLAVMKELEKTKDQRNHWYETAKGLQSEVHELRLEVNGLRVFIESRFGNAYIPNTSIGGS